jgi:hypothetical protein
MILPTPHPIFAPSLVTSGNAKSRGGAGEIISPACSCPERYSMLGSTRSGGR